MIKWLKRKYYNWRGKDIEEKTIFKYPLNEYTIQHSNGNTTTITANKRYKDGAFVYFADKEGIRMSRFTGKPLRVGNKFYADEEVRDTLYNSIESCTKERIGFTAFEVTVDRISGELLDCKQRDILHEEMD